MKMQLGLQERLDYTEAFKKFVDIMKINGLLFKSVIMVINFI